MKKWLGGNQKVATSTFDPLPLVYPCLFYMYPRQRKFTIMSYPPPPSQEKFCDAYEFSNEKLVSENREKNYFFCRLKRQKI